MIDCKVTIYGDGVDTVLSVDDEDDLQLAIIQIRKAAHLAVPEARRSDWIDNHEWPKLTADVTDMQAVRVKRDDGKGYLWKWLDDAPARLELKPVAWILTNKRGGRVLHIAAEDGWTVEAVSTEPSPSMNLGEGKTT